MGVDAFLPRPHAAKTMTKRENWKLLANDNRRDILRMSFEEGGTNVEDVTERLRIKRKTAYTYLEMLEKARFIKSVAVRRGKGRGSGGRIKIYEGVRSNFSDELFNFFISNSSHLSRNHSGD